MNSFCGLLATPSNLSDVIPPWVVSSASRFIPLRREAASFRRDEGVEDGFDTGEVSGG